MSINLSLILPCYNEEKNISILYQEFLNIPFEGITAELIFVNNGSKDGTAKEIDGVIKLNESKNNNIIVKKVNLYNNDGYGGGIAAGLKDAKGEYIGWAHADLQTPLIDVYKLFQIIKDKKKIFGKGFRTNNRGFDGIVSRFHESLASIILGYKMNEINAQPKVFSKDLLEYFSDIPKKWTVLDTYANYVCLQNNFEILKINVVFKTRIHGHSKWKNNAWNFFNHIFFNFLYLIKLRFTNVKK
tara:strand:+ start:736 stop:1464 length:729 start_codon:yes stop_codon:yes gene_type:complete